VAIRARVLKGVTRHARALIQHCQLRVGAGLEQWQRLVAARQFVVASAAIIGGVAGGASGAIERRELAVDIILPARGVGRGLHHLMALYALVFRGERWRHVLVASETFCVWRGRFFPMIKAEVFGVRRRFHGRHVAGRSGTRDRIQMAGMAACDFPRGVVAGNAIEHRRQREVRQTGAVQDGGMTGRAIPLQLEMRGVGKLYVAVLAGDRLLVGPLRLFGRVATAALAFGY